MGAAAIAAAAGIGSSIIGSDSASNAANAQVTAANTASQTELQMFNQTTANESPWMGAGQNALQALMTGMGLSSPQGGTGGSPASFGGSPGNAQWDAYLAQYPDVAREAQRVTADHEFPNADAYAQWHYQHYGRNDGHTLPQIPGMAAGATGSPGGAQAPGFGNLVAPFTQQMFQASPGFGFQMDQMMGAVQNSAASRGGLVSGNTLKALQANAGGLANQDWWNAQNNYQQQQQQRFNMLQTLSGSGQNAAANLGALGSQVAGSIGANTIGAGNSAAAGSVAQGQIWSNLLNNNSFLTGIQSMFGGGGGDPTDMFSQPTGINAASPDMAFGGGFPGASLDNLTFAGIG